MCLQQRVSLVVKIHKYVVYSVESTLYLFMEACTDTALLRRDFSSMLTKCTQNKQFFDEPAWLSSSAGTDTERTRLKA